MECDICKQIKQPTKDIKNPCYSCDLCRNLICLECSDLGPSEIKCLPLQRRTLKFHCKKCRKYELVDVLRSTIEDKERIIQEQKEIINLLKGKIQDYENKESKAQVVTYKSYADITKTYFSEEKKINYPEITIKPKQTQSSKRTREDIEKNIKPTELKVGIKKLKTAKNGTVVVACQSKEENETFKNALEQKLKNSYVVEFSKMRKPKIKITNISRNYNKEELEESIIQQNIINGTVTVTYIKKNRNGQLTAFCECSPRAYRDIINLKKINIGWERFPVYEDIGVPRCFKCQGFFHKMNTCQNKLVCPICSGEHEEKQCSKKDICCINCLQANEKFKTTHATEHHSHSQECPTLKYHLNQVKNKTDYFSEE